MNAILLAAGLMLLGGPGAPAAAAGPAEADTAVTLQRGDRVEIRGLGGEVTVAAWSRPTMEVSGEDVDARDVRVSRSGSVVTVRAGSRRGRETSVSMTLRVPEWVALDLQGRELDVSVSGVRGAVSVQNVEGDIRVRGTGGDLDLSSVEGEIDVSDARGSVRARSRGEDVRLTRVVGEVDAESGSGDVRLDGVRSASVRAETLDGDVYFAGTMVKGGQYTFSVHDGDATLVIPQDTGARVRVATFDGEFSSQFPVTVHHYQGDGRFEFTLGDGGAEVSVEVFDGEIRVLRTPPDDGRGPDARVRENNPRPQGR